MRRALELMAYSGLDVREAGRQAGMDPDSAVRAFRKKHVKDAYFQMVRELRDNAAQRAFARIEILSKTAASEHVRLEASKWVAGVDGVAPVKRVEGKFSHEYSFNPFDYGEPPVDVTPETAEDVIED